MQAEKEKDDVKTSILISLKCAMSLFAVWLSIYLIATFSDQISTGFDNAWSGIAYVWEILLIPFVAVFTFLAALPVEISFAAFVLALWSLCVNRKLVKQGLTGNFHRVTKYICGFAAVSFVVLCSSKAISEIGLWNYFLLAAITCLFIAFYFFLAGEAKKGFENY